MRSDAVLNEVRRNREAYAKQLEYDIESIHRDLRQRQRGGSHRVVSLPPRHPKAVVLASDPDRGDG